MKKLFLVGLLAVAAASASITPDLMVTNGTTYCSGSPGNCTYTYDIILAENHSVETGDFFTIYDFNGFVSFPAVQPLGWTPSAAMTGMDPVDPAIPYAGDDANVMNLTWQYAGPTLAAPGGGLTISGFQAVSTFTGVAPGRYGSQTHKPTGVTVGGMPSSSAGYVDVPGTGPGGENPIPEPMSMALLGGGLAALGLLRFRKQS